MRVFGLVFAVICFSAGSLPALAQDRQQTLADIRQQLTGLNADVLGLKRELSASGAQAPSLGGSSLLDRVNAIEAELQRLTAQTEALQNRVDRVVSDGTNRIGDLEFRLVELEGGDVSKLGQTSTLGGEAGASAAPAVAVPVAPVGGGSELALGEQADYDAAAAALSAGDYQSAADRFAQFETAYPGSPLAVDASLGRGKALDGLGNTKEAARAYLAAFSGDPVGAKAPDALYELGAALGRLGQRDQACITLGEVSARFPSAAAVATARAEMSTLGCS